MSEPIVILEDWSPLSDINAFVEKSDTCYYFYLWFYPKQDNAIIKDCWICNSAPAIDALDVEGMRMGNAPAMPKEFVKHDVNGIILDPDNLEIVWFAEGNAASLLYDGKPICVIPPWGGMNGFSGYSIYANGQAPYAWSLSEAVDVLGKRITEHIEFWNQFDDEDYWGKMQDAHLGVLQNFFGQHEKYYAIDGGNFPPKALVKGRRNGIIYGITAGISMIPMPMVEMYVKDFPEKYSHIEFGFANDEKYEDICDNMYSTISGISNMPWSDNTFLGHGHTVQYSGIEGFAALLFLNDNELSDIKSPDYSNVTLYGNAPVNLLWVVPLTNKEYKYTMENGVDSLLSLSNDLHGIHIFDGNAKFIKKKKWKLSF